MLREVGLARRARAGADMQALTQLIRFSVVVAQNVDYALMEKRGKFSLMEAGRWHMGRWPTLLSVSPQQCILHLFFTRTLLGPSLIIEFPGHRWQNGPDGPNAGLLSQI